MKKVLAEHKEDNAVCDYVNWAAVDWPFTARFAAGEFAPVSVSAPLTSWRQRAGKWETGKQGVWTSAVAGERRESLLLLEHNIGRRFELEADFEFSAQPVKNLGFGVFVLFKRTRPLRRYIFTMHKLSSRVSIIPEPRKSVPVPLKKKNHLRLQVYDNNFNLYLADQLLLRQWPMPKINPRGEVRFGFRQRYQDDRDAKIYLSNVRVRKLSREPKVAGKPLMELRTERPKPPANWRQLAARKEARSPALAKLITDAWLYLSFDTPCLRTSGSWLRARTEGAYRREFYVVDPALVKGKVGGALRFNGEDSFLNLGEKPSVRGTGPFTVAFWVKSASQAKQAVLVQSSNGRFKGRIDLGIWENGEIIFYTWADRKRDLRFTSATTVADGKWHHIVALRDKDGIGKIYIDGRLDASMRAPISPLLENHIFLGADVARRRGHLDGSLDEFGIWNRALSETEIKTLATVARGFKEFAGHTRTVRAVAFGPDGKYGVSAGDDGTIRVWDLATGRTRTILKGHDGGVQDVAVSPDGKLIASGGRDRTVRLWNLATGKELAVLKGHKKSVMSIAFSPDGKHLLSGSLDGTARLWEVAGRKEVGVLKGHGRSIGTAVFSPDGTRVATGSLDPTIRLWEVKSGKLLTTLTGHRFGVRSVAFTPDGKQLISGSSDMTVRVWDLSTGQEKQALKGHASLVSAVAVLPDGKRMLSASLDGIVHVWDLVSGKKLRSLEKCQGGVTSVAVSPDGTHALSGSRDKIVRYIDLTFEE